MSSPVVVFERDRIQQVANPLDHSRRCEIASLAGFMGESSLIDAAVAR
ncbi:MAG TPA: hypothetical protein VNS34_20665 [Rhizobiaceae bacterium]|nr:hypothetical protein [Rhizobiaceae bacterium]